MGYPMMISNRNAITFYLVYLQLFFFLLFPFVCVHAEIGSGHIADFKDVFEGLSGGRLEELQKTITSKIIDMPPDRSFLEGFSCGNHRWFGHWGFEGSIPFNRPPLSYCLQQLPIEKQELVKQKIIKEWTGRTKTIQALAEKITGLPPRQAKGFAGTLYNTHLLGDWKPGNTELKSLADVNAIKRDIEKNLHRLLGNNSDFVKNVAAEFKEIKTNNPQRMAQEVLRILRDHNVGNEVWKFHGKTLAKKGISYDELKAANTYLRRVLGTNFKITKSDIQIKSPNDYNELKNQFKKDVKIRPGLLTSNGRLLVALSEGSMAGLSVFVFEGGEAYYRLIKGHTLKPEFKRNMEDAAIKGVATAGALSVAVFLGANPAGLVVMGIAAGTYLAVNQTLNVWHRHQDSKFLTPEDLKVFGIEQDCILDIPIYPNIPLNAENWKI